MPTESFLAEALRTAVRRYRLPADPPAVDARPATALALSIEDARQAVARQLRPGAPLRQAFLSALARLIQEALHPTQGDLAFQAMLLRHQAPPVREYAELCAQAPRDRRVLRSTVDAIAHPEKLQRLSARAPREPLLRLHALASRADWPALADAARALLSEPWAADADAFLQRGLVRLLSSPALGRLERLAALSADEQVRQYQSLRDRLGPRAGSAAASAQGRQGQRRGGAVEALAAQTIEALARHLDTLIGAAGSHRVVSALHLPAALAAGATHAKTEWDVVLLRREASADAVPTWNACLLVEVKASVDAAATDLPRLLRGLRLLASADERAVYSCASRDGPVPLRGEALRALGGQADDPSRAVIYCSDAAADPAPRLLDAASRMQLLSAPASLAYAARLLASQSPAPDSLEPVWRQLLESPGWSAVLNQLPRVRQARELMVHIDDLTAAIKGPGA